MSDVETGRSYSSKIRKSTAETSYLPELIAILQSGEVLGRPRVENFREEVLGFESMRLDSSIIPGELLPAVGEWGSARISPRLGGNQQERRSFPPLLTTLKWNGRPRFSFPRESTADGRLVICMVRNERREVARRRDGDGRLKMMLVGPDDQEVGDDDDDDDDDVDDDWVEAEEEDGVFVVEKAEAAGESLSD